jgi:hypothetical protein
MISNAFSGVSIPPVKQTTHPIKKRALLGIDPEDAALAANFLKNIIANLDRQ